MKFNMNFVVVLDLLRLLPIGKCSRIKDGDMTLVFFKIFNYFIIMVRFVGSLYCACFRKRIWIWRVLGREFGFDFPIHYLLNK
jgi:hypothetical protein